LPVLLFFVQHPYNRIFAVPVGLALAWLGYALWSERGEQVSQSVAGSAKPQIIPTAVK
jgi:hypothetical protein